MNWSYEKTKNTYIAYNLEDKKLSISTDLCTDQKGVPSYCGVGDWDASFEVINKNKIKMEDWIDLRQFNNSGDLLDQIQLVNKVLGNNPLSVLKSIEKDPSVILKSVDSYDGYRINFTVTYKGKDYTVSNSFQKYCFIEDTICEDKEWDISELFDFSVQFQKILFDLENKYSPDEPMYLSISSEVEGVLVGELFERII